MFNKIFKKRYSRLYLTYVLSFVFTLLVMLLLVRVGQVTELFNKIESSTFDLRQNLIAKSNWKKPSKDIVILTVDDASYEYLLDKYGEWPIPRYVYANLIKYLEKQNPREIAFDLMFVKSLKSSHNDDYLLASTMNKYDNIFTGMNFDNEPSDVRIPSKLPDRMSVNLVDKTHTNFSDDLTFTNCRSILTQILNGRTNIGMINASREDDGILRKLPPFMSYQNKFYPHLALNVGIDYLNRVENAKIDTKNFKIDRNSNLILGKRHIPVASDGGLILNWYGPAGEKFTQVPFYKVVRAMNGDKNVQKYDFKNKLIYVGVSAVSLFDTKSVPVDKIYPGVEVHATFVNNLIDNNFIRRVSPVVDITISVILALIIGLIVIKTTSTLVALGSTGLITLGYVILSYYLMKFCNLWLSIILPVSVVVLIFISAYIIKYLSKSRDFELQYKLATTDGLTELYNHRYFQEQLIMQIENCKRYDAQFSLIMTDIDFFKKFNDTYGHQAGDAVLRGVSHTLKKNVRATDIVCRYGGEEMTIILTNTDKDEAIITAQKICQAVAENPFKLGNDLEKNVTISLGVATYPQDAKTPDALIAHADQGLYKAKENGRNQVGL